MILFLCGSAFGFPAPNPKKNLLGNPGFEIMPKDGKSIKRNIAFQPVPGMTGIKRSDWYSASHPYLVTGQASHSGKNSIMIDSRDNKKRYGIGQRILFDKPIQKPFRFGGWCKTEGANAEDEFSIYLDIFYEDGTNLWGVKALFDDGAHDWEFYESWLIPVKPIREIQYFVLFRNSIGKVWFDDLFIEEADGLLEKKIKQGDDPETLNALKIASPDSNWFAWTASPMKRIFNNSLIIPPESEQARKDLLAHPKYSLELARHEYESFQIAVRSFKDLSDLRFEISDLVNLKDSSKKISRSNIDWKQVGFIMADKLHFDPNYSEGPAGWYPDALLPVDRGTVPAGKTCPFWITVYAPEGTTPGDYQGTIRLIPRDGKPVSVELTVHVWNITLDRESHLKTAFALMEGFLEKVYQIPQDGDAKNIALMKEYRRNFGEFMMRHRLAPEGDITRTELPDLALMEEFRGRGLGAVNILNMAKPRGKSPWTCNSSPEFYTPEFKKTTLERLKPYIAQLRSKKLTKDAYIYTFDECKEQYYPLMKEYFGMIKENFPEIATFTTAKIPQDAKILDDLNVDWLCPVSSTYNYKRAEECRAQGKQIWSYICCGPGFPYANLMCRFPLIDARIIGWQSFEQKYDGLLYWGVNIWTSPKCVPIDPKDGIFLQWPIMLMIGHEIYGDGNLLYGGKNGQPIGSMRMALLRDGLEDYEYLWKLSEKLKSVDAARSWCSPVFKNPRRFTFDPDVLLEKRRQIADKIQN